MNEITPVPGPGFDEHPGAHECYYALQARLRARGAWHADLAGRCLITSAMCAGHLDMLRRIEACANAERFDHHLRKLRPHVRTALVGFFGDGVEAGRIADLSDYEFDAEIAALCAGGAS